MVEEISGGRSARRNGLSEGSFGQSRDMTSSRAPSYSTEYAVKEMTKGLETRYHCNEDIDSRLNVDTSSSIDA